MPQTCIITGASRGIGLAAALRLGRAGWKIAAAARDPARLEHAANEIRATGAECHTIPTDVGDPAAATRLVETAAARLGRIDLLVNNAGFAVLEPLERTSPADFDRTVAINISAVFHTTRAVWPLMKAQRGGVIVNLSSMSSIDPYTGFSIYGASKAWVNTFTRAVADEGKPFNIRVFAVAPGAVETQMLRGLFPDLPARHTLAPDAVAAVIESLSDDRMTAATGQTIFVRK